MKRTLHFLFLLSLFLGFQTGAWADTYTDEAATVTWAFESHEDLTSVNAPEDAFLTTNFTAGSNLNLSTFNTKDCKAGWAEQTLVYFKPTAEVAKNAGEKPENMLEWIITPANGITFTPVSVSVTACTAGGTGDPQISIYAVYTDETKETIQEKTNPKRPDKGDQGDGPSVYTKTLENAKTGKFKVRVYFQGLTNTGKGIALTNIVVTGKVSGTPEASTTYTITGAPNDTKLGSVSGTATVPENESVKLTATPTISGYFVKWQKDGEEFSGNTENPITVTATADATYTAVFEAKKTITFDKGEGTGTAPGTAYVVGGESYTAPYARTIYKTGATLTGWNDGTTSYAPGSPITVNDDMTLTAEFTDNTVALGDAEATVNWTFARKNGAPTLSCENAETDYVQQATISGTAIDVVMHVNTKDGAGVSGKRGKLNNTSNDALAQVNQGTVFTVPVVKGSVITYTGTTQTAAAGDITFGGENGEVSKSVTTFTYDGEAGTIDIIDCKGGFYPSGISVTYPQADAPDPTYTVTFEAGENGTSDETSLTEESAGAGVTLPGVTANEGFTFLGWYDAATGGNMIGSAGETYNPTANITLYAQYNDETQPATVSVESTAVNAFLGETTTLTVTVDGTPTPEVKWYRASAVDAFEGAVQVGTGAEFTPTIDDIGTYYFYAVASNGVGDDATTEMITLTVTQKTDFTIELKEGTEDADKWTITSSPAKKGDKVTLKYSGTKKVKKVTAEKKTSK